MADVARGVVKRRRCLGHGLLLGAIGGGAIGEMGRRLVLYL